MEYLLCEKPGMVRMTFPPSYYQGTRIIGYCNSEDKYSHDRSVHRSSHLSRASQNENHHLPLTTHLQGPLPPEEVVLLVCRGLKALLRPAMSRVLNNGCRASSDQGNSPVPAMTPLIQVPVPATVMSHD